MMVIVTMQLLWSVSLTADTSSTALMTVLFVVGNRVVVIAAVLTMATPLLAIVRGR